MDDTLNTIKQLLEWGFLGFMLYLNRLYWTELIKAREAHLNDLRALAGVRDQTVVDDRPFVFPTTGSEMAGPVDPRPKLK